MVYFVILQKTWLNNMNNTGLCVMSYIDIMTAHLINPQEAAGFQVMVLPNLYGDILTDQAAQIQGGVELQVVLI